MRATPPTSEEALLARARALAGLTVRELGQKAGLRELPDPSRAKGILGELVERVLGATAGSKDEPDFPHLAVELKTIPLRGDGSPKESTFVCSLSLANLRAETWESSRVRRKLARVLWVPIEHNPGVAQLERRIGRAELWSPSHEEEAALRADWEDLSALLAAGRAEEITAHLGLYLQVRPKAAHGRVVARTENMDGDPVLENPRGFYLRTAFTRRVFNAR